MRASSTGVAGVMAVLVEDVVHLGLDLVDGARHVGVL
jgi:hypothetical protein